MPKEKFYCTTPIYYVNAKPHIGTLYSTLIADVATKWNRLRGRETFFLTGTDEHGQKVAQKAAELGKAPQEFVDSMIPPFKETWELYGLEYDHFVRTTNEGHKKAVTLLIEKLFEKGEIYKSTYQGLYCTPCETFLTAEQVGVGQDSEKICPSCERAVQMVDEESYFFRLSAYQDKLLAWYEASPDLIAPKERLNEVREFVKGGLKDLSISRKTVSWGIPFPPDPSHTVYVWGDALTNYISAIGYGQDENNFSKWWPADLHVMAKDIVRFHAVYWPAFLMAAGLELPKRLLVHGYILMDDAKMSKSRGNVLDPALLAKSYGPEPVRYYLMRHVSFGQDGNVSIEQLEQTINADLSNSLGNLLNRINSLANAHGLSQGEFAGSGNSADQALLECGKQVVQIFTKEMERYNYHLALAELWKFIAQVNAYVHEQQPWKVVKQDKERFSCIVSVVVYCLQLAAKLLWPVMPKKMSKLLDTLGVAVCFDGSRDELNDLASYSSFSFDLKKEAPLFPRIDEKKPEEPAQEESSAKVQALQATIHDFAKLELRVGKILACEPVEKSEKLLRFQVSFGEHGKRQILSGIAQYFAPGDLIGKKAVFVVNFPERKMMGLASQGMLLSALDKQASSIVFVGDEVAEGVRIG